MNDTRRKSKLRKRNTVLSHSRAPVSSASDDERAKSESVSQSRFLRWRVPVMLAVLVVLGTVGVLVGLPTYWMNHANNAMLAGKFAEADEYFRRVEDWQPNRSSAILGQARSARRAGDRARARALLSIAEMRGATATETKLERTLLDVQAGGSDAMIDELPNMLVRTPEFGAEILEAFAIGFETAGIPERALPLVESWIDGAPKDQAARLHKAELLATLGELTQAEAIFATMCAVEVNSTRARRGLARVKLQLHKNDEAVTLYDAAIADNPMDIESRLLRCEALFDSRQDELAVSGLKDILSIDKFNFTATHAIASKLAETGESQAVVEIVMPIMSEFPDDVSLNYLLASAFTELGDAEKSALYSQRHLEGRKRLEDLAQLKLELKENQTDGEGILRMASGYLKYQWDEAEQWIVKAMFALPNSPEPYRAMADFQRKKGDALRAKEFSRAAKALSANL